MAFDLNLGEDQRQIRDAATAMLSSSLPLARLREGEGDDLSPLVGFGTFALAVPEAQGGAGFGPVEEALVHVLLGRHLVSTRALATAIAGAAARELGRGALADDLAAGRLEACAAMPGGGDLLVVDGDGASLAVLFDGRRIALLDLAGLARRPAQGLGHSVPVARVRQENPLVVGEAGDRTVSIADLLVCAQLLGVAEGARDLAVDYAKVRQQFGRPIGAFQAIKHHCADMAIAAEMLSAQLDMAAIALADGRGDAAFQLAALRRLAARTALGNARICIQIHGGIGFSAEADAHHFLKHAHVLSRLGSGAPMLDLPAPMAPHIPLHERT